MVLKQKNRSFIAYLLLDIAYQLCTCALISSMSQDKTLPWAQEAAGPSLGLSGMPTDIRGTYLSAS